MPSISTEQLQTISVKTVEGFLNDHVPLSEGLAKQAAAYELNSEQIQRAVEAVNSITYLKLVKVAEDRTIEFPLCKTAEVMAHITLPGMDKAAALDYDKYLSYMSKHVGDSDSAKKMDPLTYAKHDRAAMLFAGRSVDEANTAYDKHVKRIEKTASVGKSEAFSDNITIQSPTEMYHLLTKMAAENKHLLSRATDDLIVTKDSLEKAASVLARDPKASIKLEMLGVSETGIEKVAGVTEQTVGSFIFKEADLKVAKQVLDLTKKANDLQAEVAKRTELHKQAELAKQSFLSVLSKGLGYLAGKAVAIPGKAIGRGFRNTGINLKNSITNTVSNTLGPKGQKLSTPKKLGIVGVAGSTALAGTDALMYQPSKEKDIYHQMVHAGPY
jgi:predicted transcriptional regulator